MSDTQTQSRDAASQEDHSVASVREDGSIASVHEDGSIDRLTIDTIRTLAMDAVQKANSGHPGTPMAMAPVGYTLWSQFLRYDPATPDWPNRDRFVLSVGHASLLLYALIHLAGIEEVDRDGKKTGQPAVGLSDIENFRQLSSKTPGHPEYRHTTGVETTTGPLGQGCGNSVGMAIAERWLAARYNRPGFTLFDHDVYTLAGDGDLMEGVSQEAASIAGHLRLSNLCWIYDSNHITIEGSTSLAFDEDVGKRFEGYGWNVIHVDDANDCAALAQALAAFRKTDDKPTLIIVHSIIGYGFPTIAGTKKAHSDAPGEEEIKGAKRAYGWPEDKSFYVPDGVAAHFHDCLADRGRPAREQWEELLTGYRSAHPDLAAEVDAIVADTLPDGWDADIPTFEPDAKGIASRDASGKVLNAIVPKVPWLIGGSADLAPSTKTDIKDKPSFEPGSYDGCNFHFGVREHGMGAVVNGMTLSGLRGYGSTFFVFLDYMRPPVRLSALMEIGAIWIFTHDSIGVGEDGPTHQPIEQLTILRATPGIDAIRPCDANETAAAWRAIVRDGTHPTALILSRQALPTLDRSRYAAAEGLEKGAYVLADSDDPQVILIATGSEVSLAVEAYEKLKAEGIAARVVSMPSWFRYERQSDDYKESVLPAAIAARVSVEMASEVGWDRYVGLKGKAISMATFGASAPLAKLSDKFGFTADAVVKVAKAVLEDN